jgi:two-component system chemotaxis sensor kinase CheA
LVDELLGQQQMVVKSLGSGMGDIPGIAGAAILGDGRVGLILDPTGLVTLARQVRSVSNEGRTTPSAA